MPFYRPPALWTTTWKDASVEAAKHAKQRLSNTPMQPIPLAASYTATLVVTEAHSAAALGSGDLPVLGTPAMAALMEQAAMQAITPFLTPEAESSVGISLQIAHNRATAIGDTIRRRHPYGRKADRLRRHGARLLRSRYRRGNPYPFYRRCAEIYGPNRKIIVNLERQFQQRTIN